MSENLGFKLMFVYFQVCSEKKGTFFFFSRREENTGGILSENPSEKITPKR